MIEELEKSFEEHRLIAESQLMNIGVSLKDESGDRKSLNQIIDELVKVFLLLENKEMKIVNDILDKVHKNISQYFNLREQNMAIKESIILSLVGIRNANKLLSIINSRMDWISHPKTCQHYNLKKL